MGEILDRVAEDGSVDVVTLAQEFGVSAATVRRDLSARVIDIVAPIGKPVHYATLTITARFCYSTPASETPETTAFVQIDDHRPDQPARRVFSGWMYGSSPGLNGVEHPLYDVWVISCNNAPAPALAANTSTAPVKVKAPDSSDKEGIQALPEGAGQ